MIMIRRAEIAGGLGSDFEAAVEICAKVRARLLPWAPTDVSAWDSLRWANGRLELSGVAPPDVNWRWHCAPLSEWDGTIPRRE